MGKLVVSMAILLLCLYATITAIAATDDLLQVAKEGNKVFYTISAETVEGLSWEDALKFCTDNNLKLTTIDSKAQNDLVSKAVKKLNLPRTTLLWLGATRKDDGSFEWHNGKPLTYTNWPEDWTTEGKDQSKSIYLNPSTRLWDITYDYVAHAMPLCEKYEE